MYVPLVSGPPSQPVGPTGSHLASASEGSPPRPTGDRRPQPTKEIDVTDQLQPFVRELLDDAIEARDLDPAVVEELLERAKREEGHRLEESVRRILRGA